MAKFASFFYGQMSGIEITCIQSFIDHGHDIIIYSYGPCGAPSHFKLADAETIIPKESIFFYGSNPGKGSVAAFTNLFRYTALARQENTWWTDTDVICLSTEWPEVKNVGVAWESQDRVGSAVLYLNQEIAKNIANKAASLGRNISWGQAGPQLVTSHLRERNMTKDILRSTAFFPIAYDQWFLPFLANCTERTEQLCASAYAVHLWHEMGRRVGFDKGVRPDPESFIGQVVERHGTADYFSSSVRTEPIRAIDAPQLLDRNISKAINIAIANSIQPLERKIDQLVERQRAGLTHKIGKKIKQILGKDMQPQRTNAPCRSPERM